MTYFLKNKETEVHTHTLPWIRFDLFEFRPNLALHLGRSLLNHSYGYASAGDRPTCLARFGLLLEPHMKYTS
jgi:hypothetical protein